MQITVHTKDTLEQMSQRLNELSLQFEPALEAPTELRLIAQLIDQFKRRPLEPLSFQQMHLDHLIDMIDNADTPVDMWSAVTQTLADYYVSQYWGNMNEWVYDNYLEIEPPLHQLAVDCYNYTMTSENKNFEYHRQMIKGRVQSLTDMISKQKIAKGA